MKNKKILNICLLTFGLLALFTFILPIKKYEFVGDESGFINVMFYLLNAIMIVGLVALVIMAIINLFKDNYKLIKLMEIMALLGIIMVFMVLLIFSCSIYARINIGYLLVAIEMFACANFSQMARLVNSSTKIKESLMVSSVKTNKTKNAGKTVEITDCGNGRITPDYQDKKQNLGVSNKAEENSKNNCENATETKKDLPEN